MGFKQTAEDTIRRRPIGTYAKQPSRLQQKTEFSCSQCLVPAHGLRGPHMQRAEQTSCCVPAVGRCCLVSTGRVIDEDVMQTTDNV